VSHDLAVERAVLGAVLHSGGRLLGRLELTAEDFHAPAHEELWRAMLAADAAGRPVEVDALLAVAGARAAVLGPALAECVTAAAVPASAEWYAEQLRTHTMRRSIAGAANRLAQLASDDVEREPAELTEIARGIVDTATARDDDAGGTSSLDEQLAVGLQRWCTPDTDVLPTGWLELDEQLTGGLRPGHLTVVGARPSVGKSLVATELAAAVAGRGTRVLFSSLEMSAAEVTNRIASSGARVPLTALTAGTCDEEEMDQLARFHTRAHAWPLEIDDRAAVGVTAIRGRARDLTRRPHGLGLVIVDYLQLVAPADRKAPREQQVASVSRGLKLLARDLHVPVVALAQVNRGSTQRESKRPVMSDLRESGAIEADADEIWLLHRDDKEFLGELEVNVVKNRHGQTGPIRLGWWPHIGRISNMHRYSA
jgi:replicative DNA helicase